MFNVVANEVLGDGSVIFFQNPITSDIVCSIDGVDNEKFVSWHGIREGVVGYPTCMNHMDLWLNNVYHRNELEGLAKFKDESDDAWDYKEREILAKFATWQRVAVCGRVSADGNVLQFINTSGSLDKSKEVIEHMLNKGLVEESTRLFINNKDFDSVGKFLVVNAQCALFAREQERGEKENMLTSQVLIQAQLEEEKKTAKHTQELMSVLEPYRALKQKLDEPDISDEQKEEIKQQMKEVSSPVMNLLYEDYYPMIIKEVAKYAKNYDMKVQRGDPSATNLQGGMETSVDYYAPAVLAALAKSFLNNFDPSRATISTFVGSQAGGFAKNIINKQRSQDKQYKTVGPAWTDDEGADVGSAGDVAGSNDPVANVTEPMFGAGPREKGPMENVLTPLINNLSDILDSKEMDIIKKYFYDKMTLDQIGKEYNVTRERIRQIIEGITNKLKTPEVKKRLGLAKKKFPLSIQ